MLSPSRNVTPIPLLDNDTWNTQATKEIEEVTKHNENPLTHWDLFEIMVVQQVDRHPCHVRIP